MGLARQLAIAAFAALMASGGAQFASYRVRLNANLPLSTFSATSGNGCWGYVSPSGREYALMGLNNKVAFVEVTNPSNPVYFANVPHTSSQWGEMKVYRNYAYVVTEAAGTGIQVIDLSNIDNHVVTLVRTITSPGRSHNIAIDEYSGYLYTCGSRDGAGTTMVFDLTNPANPVHVGTWTTTYQHDAQVVTYTSGPYAGRQIFFGASEGRGLEIIDVTNKSNMFRVSLTSYPQIAYCHQGWLSADRRYFYVNDELDEQNFLIPTRTLVFDVSNINAPFLAGTFTTGLPATDHNLYVHNGYVFESNYKSGVRIFDTSYGAVNPRQVGWFDTYPADDSVGFAGTWSNFPFFPSGTLIASDINRGLFVLDPSEALVGLEFEYPNGRPELINPNGGTRMRVKITGRHTDLLTTSPKLYYGTGSKYTAIPLEPISSTEYDAVFPAVPCLSTVRYYISAEATNGKTYTDPWDASTSYYTAIAADSVQTIFTDNFQTNQGWTVQNVNLTDGAWVRAVPVGNGGARGDPPTDYDGSGMCYVTGNGNNQDVDGGPTILTSPTINMSMANAEYRISYARWFYNDDGDDRMIVEISNNNGASWVTIESVSSISGWVYKEVRVADYVTPTATMRIRFSVADNPNNSVTEGGLDAVKVIAITCNPNVDVLPSSFTVRRGTLISGTLQSLFNSDNDYIIVHEAPMTSPIDPSAEIEVVGTSPTANPGQLVFLVEASSSGFPVDQQIMLYNYSQGVWELMDSRRATYSDTTVVISINSNASRFVNPSTREMRARIGFVDRVTFTASWVGRYDRTLWTITQ